MRQGRLPEGTLHIKGQKFGAQKGKVLMYFPVPDKKKVWASIQTWSDTAIGPSGGTVIRTNTVPIESSTRPLPKVRPKPTARFVGYTALQVAIDKVEGQLTSW